MDVEFNLVLPMGGRWILAIRPAPDATALWIATGSLLVSLVVFGLEPALQLTRSRDLRGELAAGVGVLGAPKTRRQRTLLRWQVAISAGFFIVATMFVKYTIAEARHDPGIDLKRLGVAVLNFRTQQWDEARVRRTVDRVVEEARKDQAIEAVSVSTGMPLGLPAMRLTLWQPETAIGGTPDRHNAVGVAATPSLFKTIGVPILRGRGFDDRDHAAAAPVVVLSEFTARRIFGTSDAVGRPVVVEGHGRVTATVIGVARDTDVGYVFGESRPVVYLPLAQRYEPFLAIVARSTGRRRDGRARPSRGAPPGRSGSRCRSDRHRADGPRRRFRVPPGRGRGRARARRVDARARDGRPFRHSVAHRRAPDP